VIIFVVATFLRISKYRPLIVTTNSILGVKAFATRPEDYANEELQKDLLVVIDRFADADVPLVIMGHSYGATHMYAKLPQIQQRF
jgi:hypothetical protein